MKAEEIREGDIVEIDYITEFAKEHINEGKALVIWKGFNNQPLVRKLDTKAAIWTCYEHIARVVGHIDIEGYMDRALSAEPCEDCISREDALMALTGDITDCTIEEFIAGLRDKLSKLPSVTPKEKTWHWIQQPRYDGDDQPDLVCPNCGFKISWWDMGNFCAKCGKGLEGGAG